MMVRLEAMLFSFYFVCAVCFLRNCSFDSIIAVVRGIKDFRSCNSDPNDDLCSDFGSSETF